MKYISTRGGDIPRCFSEVVLEGLARDGGLFVPAEIPDFSEQLDKLKGLYYRDLALKIFQPFVDSEIPDKELKTLIDRSYQSFELEEVTPLLKVGEHYVLELFHGPTLAFKDVALQFLGNLFEYFLQKQGDLINILGATSGDTGSAAIHGVRGKAGIVIFMLHPRGKVSPIQEKQMTTILDKNVYNIAISGTFDDAQKIVKDIFNDLDFKDRYSLGAVNSINWVRVMAQIVYYFYAAFRFFELEPEAPLVFSVPTGNFGDIYAGYLAQKMGLPIEKLILATNENDILCRAVTTGDYSIGEVKPTISPSMDIQISSNFERYLFDLFQRKGELVIGVMDDLKQRGGFQIGAADLIQIKKSFLGMRIDTKTTLACIKIQAEYNYILDPHSATGVAAAERSGYQKVICLATAHPAKFDQAVVQATGKMPEVPPPLQELLQKESRCLQTAASREDIKAIMVEALS
jgi:threonine synthase